MTLPLKLNRRHKVALFIALVLAGIAALSGALAAVLLSSAVAFAQDSAQAAPQAQESSAQKLLMDSIEKLDVTGVRTALANGANPQRVAPQDKESVIGALAFMIGDWQHMAVDKPEQKAVEILEVLLEAGARLEPGENLLYVPISSGCALFTEALLKNGASATGEIGGITPMELAVRNGQANIIGLLSKHGVPALEPREAAQQRLIGAADNYDIPGMADALDAGADVNGSTRQGETALVVACHFFLGKAWQFRPILYLLKKGADPAIQGSDTRAPAWLKTTALHVVMDSSSSCFDQKNQKNERIEDDAGRAVLVIKLLLQNGALVSARDYAGQTPLHIAAERNNIVGAQMLIDAGCKMMPVDDEGKTPLDYAESAEMIKLLKDHGAKEQ